MDAVTAAAAMGALPAANGLPDDPIEASTVSRLFPHPPAADSTPSSTPAALTAASGSVPVSPRPTSPPRTPAAPISLRSAASPSSLLGSPASERANPMSHAGVHPAHLTHSLHQHQHQPHRFGPSEAVPSHPSANSSGFRSPVRVRQHGAASPIGSAGTSPPGLASAHAVPWQHADLHASHTPHTPRSPSIFERDIEHRDASHIMTKQEAMDVAIPSVLDDAVEAIIEDDAEIEVVAPQNPAPPLALSSAALSAHSGASSPSFGLASSPSPPLSASGPLDAAPPGTMAAQIAEKLAPRGSVHEDPNVTPRRAAAAPASRRPGSDVDSAGHSMRSRSPQAARLLDLGESGSPVRSRTSASPGPGLPPVSLVAAVSHAQATSPLPTLAAGSSPMPTATAFPSLPLPNPFRSSSPNLSAMAIPSLTTGADAGRPATSSVSIDGAIISGTEVATLDHSLDTIADVLAAHDAEQAASPYVPRSPAPPAASGTNSPTVDKSRGAAGSVIRQPQQHPGMGAAGANRAAAPGTLGLPTSTNGLGFNTGESLFQSLASGSPSPSADKRRLSFFSYADILNENKGEVMDLQEVVRHAAERDEQQHGLFHPQAHAHQHSPGYLHAAEMGSGYETFSSQPSIMQQLGGASMARSVSTSAAASPRIGSAPGARSTSGGSTAATVGAGSGVYTPARGRRDHLENKALSNRLDSLQLATSSAAEASMRRAA
ncbi:hypothetical protein PHSY_002170 [Pseudozyma hubeiensis SY62]|uniref:Uncharacterized protein n=1 Tax=Pseudozyma hubeiensis (strain SY62) TaxID=1305764 RepID=R9P0L8_PSEHS|nr:hypothetical protein PHSY_002170 [Pseudozyma hubeiensis SY62]GAC94597.1 hypothetical protein PHSY_002170 [Pseudozyma hubeiensis SY62]